MAGALLGRATPGTDGSYTIQVDTAQLVNGAQTLVVNAWDSPAGQPFAQTARVSVNVTVSNVAPSPAPSPAGVSLTDYGGKCDGITDNNSAILNGLADARAKGVPLVIPAGQCNFSDIIRLCGAKITGQGPTCVLYATRWDRASIFMSGAAPSVTNVKLTGAPAPGRQSAWDSTKVTIFGATDFVIEGVTIEGAPAASIQTAQRPTRGRIANNIIRNSLADSIHMTDGATFITVEGNRVENSGDDGIAIVSYAHNPVRVSDITVRNNVVLNNRHGRNISVVGGADVTYHNNYMEGNSSYACLYIVREGNVDWQTWAVDRVTATRNTLKSCGSTSTGHAAVMIYSDGTYPVNDVLLQYNDIIQDNRAGIRFFGLLSNIRLDQNRYTGSGVPTVGSSSAVTITPYTGGDVGYVAP